jgi:hypothetical protein
VVDKPDEQSCWGHCASALDPHIDVRKAPDVHVIGVVLGRPPQDGLVGFQPPRLHVDEELDLAVVLPRRNE